MNKNEYEVLKDKLKTGEKLQDTLKAINTTKRLSDYCKKGIPVIEDLTFYCTFTEKIQSETYGSSVKTEQVNLHLDRIFYYLTNEEKQEVARSILNHIDEIIESKLEKYQLKFDNL